MLWFFYLDYGVVGFDGLYSLYWFEFRVFRGIDRLVDILSEFGYFKFGFVIRMVFFVLGFVFNDLEIVNS